MSDASTEAVEEIVANIAKRWPRQADAVLAAGPAYIRVIRGASARPILTADQIREVGNEVLDVWTGMKFPQPGDFAEAVNRRVVDTDRARGREQSKSNRVSLSEAIHCGVQVWAWEHVPLVGPHWQALYGDQTRDLTQQDRLAVEREVAATIKRRQAHGHRQWPKEPGERLRGVGTFKSLGDAIWGVRGQQRDAAE